MAYTIEKRSNLCKREFKNTCNGQDAVTTCLEKIFAIQQSH